MSINLNTSGIHHLALRSTNLARSKQFYVDTLGFAAVLDTPQAFVFAAGGMIFGVFAPNNETPVDDRFSPFRAGLDHIALKCESEAELSRVAAALQTAGVENTGVKLDEAQNKNYVAFKDPDRIQWEFYLT